MIIKKQKGFTLIELLAAVVILGILMIVAIPRVSKYIEDSRKKTYVNTAQQYISAAKYGVANGNIQCDDGESIRFSALEVDKGEKSSLGNISKDKSFVLVNIGANNEYKYSVFMTSDKSMIIKTNGGSYYTAYEEQLSSDDIVSYNDSIATSIISSYGGNSCTIINN